MDDAIEVGPALAELVVHTVSGEGDGVCQSSSSTQLSSPTAISIRVVPPRARA